MQAFYGKVNYDTELKIKERAHSRKLVRGKTSEVLNFLTL